jgi:multidrug resistance efflux pump
MIKLGFWKVTWLVLLFLCLPGLLALWWWNGKDWLPGSQGATAGAKGSAAVPLPNDALLVGTGEITVDGGLLALSPLGAGVVESIAVQEGQAVAGGAVLLRLRSDAAQSQLDQARAAVQVALIRLDQAREALAEFDTDRGMLAQAVRAAQARVDAQQHQVERARQLLQSKLISEAEVRALEAQLRGYQAALEVETLRQKRFSKVESERQVQLAQANLTAAQAGQKAAQDLLDQYTLSAPEDGKVLKVSARVGQILWPGRQESAVLLLPDNRPWIVRCEVEQRFAEKLTVGMSCEISTYELTEPEWKGHVERLSDYFASPRNATFDFFQTAAAAKRECVVTIQPGGPPLRAGKRVRVVFQAPTVRHEAR